MLKSVHEAEFDSEVLSNPQPVLVDFYAIWCGPCRLLLPVLEDLSESYPEISFVKVNVDEDPNLARTFDVRNLPTLLVFHGGKVVAKNIGSASRFDLEKLLGLRS